MVTTPATNTVSASIPVGSGPVAVAITPDGTRAYVVNEGDSTISVIDTVTNTVVGSPIGVSIPRGSLFQADLAVTPDGGHVYVAGGPIVTAIATATNTVSTTISGVPPGSLGLAITPDGASVYVADAT